MFHEQTFMNCYLYQFCRTLVSVQKLASDPRVRETAAKAARVVVDEAEQTARREDKALNAGRAVRRAMNKLQGRST